MQTLYCAPVGLAKLVSIKDHQSIADNPGNKVHVETSNVIKVLICQ